MAGFVGNIEDLLEETYREQQAKDAQKKRDEEKLKHGEGAKRAGRNRDHSGERPRSSKGRPDDGPIRSSRNDRDGRARSRSRDREKHRAYDGRDRDRGDRRSRSPRDDRFHRYRSRQDDGPEWRDRPRDDGDRGLDREPRRARGDRNREQPQGRGRRDGRRSREKTPEPPPNEDERDKRTVFVQQLAARLRTKDLAKFFTKAGPVKEAQIVKDRVSGRSKGVGYVEFHNEESVAQAIQLTGQQLEGIPIIAQYTEAEKNRQARNTDTNQSNNNPTLFHRLYIGNIHFSITEEDLQNVFEPFGELQYVQLNKNDEDGRSKGFGFVQYHESKDAKEALEKMNGFELAGRAIRVGLGDNKFTDHSTQQLLQRFGGQVPSNHQGSAFSGSGGRGVHAGGSSTFDRAANDKGAAGASALDDSDVGGVNFNNYSRDALMRKLARTDESASNESPKNAKSSQKGPLRPAIPVIKPPIAQPNSSSRSVVLRNMFEMNEFKTNNDIKELEDEVKAECEDKYGHVVHIKVDPNTQGDIYVRFDRAQGGENAIKGLNGRFFAGRVISAQLVVDAVYRSLFNLAT